MKKWHIYFKKENGESFDEYIEAMFFEDAVNIADAREDAEIDVEKTVTAFFKEN